MSKKKKPVGRPVQAPRKKSNKKAEPQTKAIEDSNPTAGETEPEEEVAPGAEPEAKEPRISGRRGDTTVGRPLQAPKKSTKTTTPEQPITLQDLEKEEEEQKEKALESLDPFVEPVQLPSFLSSTSILILLTVGLTVLSLFIYAQTVSVIAALFQLPAWLRWPGLTILVLLLLILLVVFFRVVRLYRKLQANRQISVVRVQAHSLTEGSGERAYGRVKKELQQYLTNFDLDAEKTQEHLEHMGLNADQSKQLVKHRERLLSQNVSNSAAWIQDFERNFLEPLDTISHARVQQFARRVAIKTALSPNGLLDTAIVLYNSFQMFADLCRIYQIRTSRFGTWYMLMLVVFHSYVAGEVGDNIGELSEDLADIFGESLGNVGAVIAGKVAAKSAEAAGHFFFTRRVGRRACQLLRPIAPVNT